MSQPVSIIIVNYNAVRLLTRSLEALRKQTLGPNQIYVVDNASRDGSCDRIPADFPARAHGLRRPAFHRKQREPLSAPHR